MRYLHSDTRLTDELERELARRALEEQRRIHLGRFLRKLVDKLFARAAGAHSVSHQLSQSAR